jgi:hypothetical protein
MSRRGQTSIRQKCGRSGRLPVAPTTALPRPKSGSIAATDRDVGLCRGRPPGTSPRRREPAQSREESGVCLGTRRVQRLNDRGGVSAPTPLLVWRPRAALAAGLPLSTGFRSERINGSKCACRSESGCMPAHQVFPAARHQRGGRCSGSRTCSLIKAGPARRVKGLAGAVRAASACET